MDLIVSITTYASETWSPLKAISPKPIEKIAQIQKFEAGHPRKRSQRCDKTQGFLSLPQSAEHRKVVIRVQSVV